jgi:hypothetical protein
MQLDGVTHPTGVRDDVRRFALVALTLPTAIMAVDHLAWMNRSLLADYVTWHQFFFVWLVVKTALLAWFAGRMFGATLYGWILLGWGIALIDVNTFRASLGSDDVAGLAYTSLSAQLGFLVLWSILATTAAAWRIAAGMVATAGIIFYATSLHSGWSYDSMPITQALAAVVVAILCISLRLAGFRLQQLVGAPELRESKQREIFQFGVKHMLIWTTALPPLLLVMKGIDWFVYRRLGYVDLFPAALISVCTALVTLATIWLVLGQGNIVLRIAFAAFAILVAGLTMYAQSSSYLLGYGPWPNEPMIRMTVTLGGLWGVWFALVSGLLAAMLLFLRAAGYRLVRPQPPKGLNAS